MALIGGRSYGPSKICLVPPRSEKGEATREARGAQQIKDALIGAQKIEKNNFRETQFYFTSDTYMYTKQYNDKVIS